MALCVRFLMGCRVGGRIMPRRDRACRRARGRQGRCAPLTRWPEAGPSLTAAARAGTGRAQVGTEGWRRSNRRMERKRQSSGCRHLADGTQRGDFWGRLPALPLPTRCRECRKRKRAAARYRADCRCVPALLVPARNRRSRVRRSTPISENPRLRPQVAPTSTKSRSPLGFVTARKL